MAAAVRHQYGNAALTRLLHSTSIDGAGLVGLELQQTKGRGVYDTA